MKESAIEVKYGTSVNVKANITPYFADSYELQNLTLEYDFDGDYSNGISGTAPNNTLADTEMTFVLPYLKWGDWGGVFYRIHQWNTNGVHRFSTNTTAETPAGIWASIRVTDTDKPKSKFVSQNASISYHQDLHVTYNITDQVNASGLDFSPTGNVFLYYYVTTGSAPADNTTYTSRVTANDTLNPGIRSGGQFINGSVGSSYVNFTIPHSMYKYGDTIYHWVEVKDRAGCWNGTFANIRSIVVDDTVVPEWSAAAGNTANASFHQDKLVTFTVREPTNSSGLVLGSVKCVWYNGSNYLVNSTLDYETKNLDDFTFRIAKENAHYGNLDEQVTFLINASDSEGNKIITGNVFTYWVTDWQPPNMTLIFDNFSSNPNYAGDTVIWRATFEDPDAPGPWPSTCARLSSAILYVRNSSGAPLASLINASSQYNATIPSNISVSGLISATVQFNITGDVLSARQEMYYLIQVNDSRYGVFNYTGNFHVKDAIIPDVRFDRVRNTTDGTVINYNEDAVFWFNATEPVDAAGFADGIRLKTVVWYKVANNLGQAPISALDFTGSAVLYNSTFSSYTGGYFEFRVPNAAFAYNQYVWAWVNITDTQYNYNNTFQLGLVPYVRINDTILPSFAWGVGHNDNPNSYHLNKSTRIVPAEPLNDASGIAAIRVYWCRNAPVTLPSTINYINITNFTLYGGIILFVDVPNEDFYYGDTIYYVFQITDVVGNIYNTTDRSFGVIDTKAPNYTNNLLNAEFFWLQSGKSKNFTFTLSDPEYHSEYRSSGLKNISFYYKISTLEEYLFNGTIPLLLDDDTVTFQLPYNVTFEGSTNLYYKIIVYDIYGSVNESTGSIRMATGLTITVTSPQKVSATVTYPDNIPWSQMYYHNSKDITFRFVFTGTLLSSSFPVSSAVWYKLDNEAMSDSVTPGGDLSISVVLTLLTEGEHNITFWHYNATLLGYLEFKIDVTRPNDPKSLTAVMKGEVVQLTWTAVTDADLIVYYVLYRGFEPDFDPSKGEGVVVRTELITTSVEDDDILMDMTTYYYKLYAMDLAGNLSALPATASFSKPIPIWMWIIVAGIAIGVVVGLVVVARARGERKLLMAAMEKSDKAAPVSKEEDWTKVAAAARKRQESVPAAAKESATKASSEGKKWATIQTIAAAKPATPQPAPAGRGTYWKGELQELLTKVVQAEEAGNFAEELRVLEIVQRVAQQMQDQETLTMAQQKIKDIWAKLNAQN